MELPGTPIVRFAFAIALAATGVFASAQGLVTESLANSGEAVWTFAPNRTPTGQTEKASRAVASGDYAAAITPARLSLAQRPLDAATLRLLAVSQLNTDNAEGAGRSLTLASQLGWRDTATQFLLFQVARESGDVNGAAIRFDSMARQMKAEREKRAQILESEGLRQSAILKAEGEKQASILSAEGDKQAVMLEAEGRREAAFRDAEARERAAEAEAKATAMVSQAIAEGNVQAINYFVANNYVKALEKLASAPNQKVLMMPLEAASVIGSLAGLAQITGEAFGGGGAGGQPARPAPKGPSRPSVPSV